MEGWEVLKDQHRYRWPTGPYQRIYICCTGHGKHRTAPHRLERFGYARVWPEGPIDLRLRPSLDSTGGVRLGQSDWSKGDLPHTALHCSECLRGPRLQPATLRAELHRCAAGGLDRLDLSMLGF
jgi:hypothetical protein